MSDTDATVERVRDILLEHTARAHGVVDVAGVCPRCRCEVRIGDEPCGERGCPLEVPA